MSSLLRRFTSGSRHFVNKQKVHSCLNILLSRPCSSSQSNVNENDINSGSETKKVEYWDDPWLYAEHPELIDSEAIPIQQPIKYTVSKLEWQFVERVLPPKLIPEPPTHASYPTPSGWAPPKFPPPDLPYYIKRTRFHQFPISLECRRDEMDEKTFEYDYVEIVVLYYIDGDVFACENDLRIYLENEIGHKIASHVTEHQGKIRIRGVDKYLVEQFLLKCGF